MKVIFKLLFVFVMMLGFMGSANAYTIDGLVGEWTFDGNANDTTNGVTITAESNISSASTSNISIDNFVFTTESYSYGADMSSIITSTFGSNYRLGDWNDIVQYYQEGGDMDLFTDYLGSSRKWVSYNGNEFYSSNRHYFINVSYHNTPSGFLAHDNIDSHLIDLGSWWNSRPILAFTDTPNPNPVPEPTTIVLLGIGLAGLAGAAIRQRQKSVKRQRGTILP